jgi:hypothetical protein
MTFCIAFDLPTPEGDLSGTPVFAGAVDWHGQPVPAFFATIDHAARFTTEDQAEEYLAGTFGANVRPFGVVVEVGASVAA